ncbi:MAG TPA: amidohydrolase family protein [Candidatus Eisenbacteria bacterium]|nr:amidohydrolase family protein [Candidatus Eisenbacteria bacterium]
MERGTTLYHGGRVLVMDGGTPPAEALVVRDGKVAAVGTASDMARVAGAGAVRVPVGGATIMPGLVDTHPHLIHFGAFAEPLVDLSDARDHDDIVARLARRAAGTPPGEWVMATPVGEPHYFLRRSWRDLPERMLPDRHVLDRATRDHPVWIQAWAPVIPNVCAFNSAGLAALGLGRETPARVENVWIEKDAGGEPTGRLTGSVNNYYTNDAFMNRLLRELPLLRPETVLPGARRAMAAYNRLGVTAVYEGHAMGHGEIGAYRALRAEGALTVRVLTALEAEAYGLPWTHGLSMAEFDEHLEEALAMTDRSDDWLRADGVTLSRGGPCWPGFLRMHEPYRGPYGEPTTGVTFVEPEKEERALGFCAARGLRLNFIGAGYRDHDDFLPRAEAVAARDPSIRERGWILQHAYLVTPEQARRYAALGFRVTTSMSFSWGKGDLFAERVGRHVWADLIPLRRLLDAGLVVGCGTDWGPKNVFEHVQLAETHRFCGSGHRNDGPAQKVTRAEALSMWTRDAARVLGWDGIGTLAPGSHADFIVVDRDPLACSLDDLPSTRVLRTVVAGRTVFEAS